jgi:hypothetical protein
VRIDMSRGSQLSFTTVCARLRMRRSEFVETKQGEVSVATCLGCMV